MASKKCPKCGEDNPAEAVMCWACYTPLSGGPAVGGMGAATASLGASAGVVGKAPIGVPGGEETAKSGMDMKTMGIAGALLLVIAGAGLFMSGVFSGGGGDGGFVPSDPTGGDSGKPSSGTGTGTGASIGGTTPSLGSSGAGGNAPSAAPEPMPFSTVSAPNPNFATGTVGILVASDKGAKAEGLARFAKDQLMKNGKWRNMQVCVFVDQATADRFKSFQNPRKGAPLTRSEFDELANSGVWNQTPVFYQSKGKSEKVFYPSRSPGSWYSGIS